MSLPSESTGSDRDTEEPYRGEVVDRGFQVINDD